MKNFNNKFDNQKKHKKLIIITISILALIGIITTIYSYIVPQSFIIPKVVNSNKIQNNNFNINNSSSNNKINDNNKIQTKINQEKILNINNQNLLQLSLDINNYPNININGMSDNQIIGAQQKINNQLKTLKIINETVSDNVIQQSNAKNKIKSQSMIKENVSFLLLNIKDPVILKIYNNQRKVIQTKNINLSQLKSNTNTNYNFSNIPSAKI